MRLATTLLALSGLAAGAAAQGADLCAAATPIAGTGLFPFDTTAATTDGLPDTLCFFFGQDNIENDVWFTWTAPNDGTFEVSTCGLTSVDTRIAIYDGGCAGPVLTCNDDSCGTLQTEVSWGALAGSTYLIRIGTYPGATPGPGDFEIREDVPFLNPANGHHYQIVETPAHLTWDQARAAAAALTFQGSSGHLATLTDQTEHDFVFSIGDPHYCWIGGFQNTASPTYAEPAGGWEWITGEPFAYTAWLAGEPNNAGPNGAEDHLELLGPSAGFPASWNDSDTNWVHSRGFVVEFPTGAGQGYCYGDGSGGVCPCGNAGATGEGCANSSGAGAVLSSSGSNSAASDDLQLSATGLLPGQAALLFSGSTNLGNGFLLGDGLRCAGGQVVRIGVRIPDAGGAAAWPTGLGALYGWGAGTLRTFQVWYRDTGGSPCASNFNLSNGVEVLYGP